jgi:hypothetical protein
MKMVDQDLIDQDKRVREQATWYHANKYNIHAVAENFKEVGIDVVRANLAYEEVDINVAGDRHTLNGVFSIFRKLGYEPTDRPGTKPEASFYCRWTHPDHNTRFWLHFTSTKCTRVKVGTETREVDVYETVCD